MYCKGILGKNKFKLNDKVKFRFEIKHKEFKILEGIIITVDSYGSYTLLDSGEYGMSDEPTYDILVKNTENNDGIYKHIRESLINFE